MDTRELRVLIADDDEDDYILTRDLLQRIGRQRFRTDWTHSYEAALQAIELNQELKLEVASLRDPGRIDVIARNQLGLTAPASAQIAPDDQAPVAADAVLAQARFTTPAAAQ